MRILENWLNSKHFDTNSKWWQPIFIRVKMEMGISSHLNQSMDCSHFYSCSATFVCLFACFPVHSYSQLWDGINNKRRKITVHLYKVTDRSLPEARVAPVLQTEKPLTHPASCHHAKGSTNPPPQVAHWSMTGGRDEAMGDARKKPRRKRQKGASRQWNVASHST